MDQFHKVHVLEPMKVHTFGLNTRLIRLFSLMLNNAKPQIINKTAIWPHVYQMDVPKICTHYDHQPPKAISSFVIFVPFHLCHVFSTSSFYSSNFFLLFFFWLIGLKIQSANIIMNKKLSVCENIPERAQTTHHHPPPSRWR